MIKKLLLFELKVKSLFIESRKRNDENGNKANIECVKNV